MARAVQREYICNLGGGRLVKHIIDTNCNATAYNVQTNSAQSRRKLARREKGKKSHAERDPVDDKQQVE